MTAPNFFGPHPNKVDAKDALETMGRMLTGTKELQNQPGVVYTLAQAQASPQEAGAIDQFMQSEVAEQQVTIARAAGTKIVLSPQQQVMLRQNGVDYRDVLYTKQDATKALEERVNRLSGGDATLKVGPNGNPVLDANGDVQVVPTSHPEASSGWFDSFGSFFGHIGHDIAHGASNLKQWTWNDGIDKTLHGMNRAWNVVSGNLGSADNNPFHMPSVSDYIDTNAAPDANEMRLSGYDPSSIWSTLAFESSGKWTKSSTLDHANGVYGKDHVDIGIQYLANPEAYRAKLAQDPTNYQVINGQTVLSDKGKAAFAYLSSPKFNDMIQTLAAGKADIGTDVAAGVGIDPIKHPLGFAAMAAGTNLVASFALDPTMIGLGAVKAVKLSQVGIDTLGDSERAASILTRSSKLPWVNNVQRGWQRAIDLGGQFREAKAAGDTAKMAATTAQMRASLPALEPIWENFTGGDRVFQGFHDGEAVFGHSDGIQNLNEAADFVQSRFGLLRLMNGRAATESGLMPGALSVAGYRKLKGLTSGWMTTRSAVRAQDSYRSVEVAASMNPELATKLIDEGMLTRLMPQANDAIDINGNVIAQTEDAGSGLASAQRGDAYQLTAAGKGQVVRNLRATGDPLGETVLKFGWASPTAVAARAKLATQRFSTLLPRNTVIDLNDARSGDTIYKFALTYLNRGDANTLRALWAAGDGAQRKLIVQGLIDQVGHAAGLAKTQTGRDLLARAKTMQESYSAAGSEVMQDGTPLALFEGQTTGKWTLPSFQEIHKASGKLGLWEATMGRGFNNPLSDFFGSQWKLSMIGRPATVTRNWLEGWLRTALDGGVGDAIKAKAFATARNKELWDRGIATDGRDVYIEARQEADRVQALLKQRLPEAETNALRKRLADAKEAMASVENRAIVQHLVATEKGDAELAKTIEKSPSMLTGQTLGRSKFGQRLADFGPLAIAGKAYRELFYRHMSPEEVDAFFTLGHDEMAEAMEGYGQQVLASDLGFHRAAVEAGDIAKAGFGPSNLRYTVHQAIEHGKAVEKARAAGVAWTHQALDGTEGVTRYANALAQRVNAMPETARAALAHIENPTADGLPAIVAAMEKEAKLTGFGKLHFPDPVNQPNLAIPAVTAAEKAAGKLDWAQKAVDEYLYLLTGQNGVYQKQLADYIAERGEAPSANWIADHLTGDNRPESALAPQVLAMQSGGIRSLPGTLQDIEGAGFQWLVERQLQRTTSSPVWWANYAKARAGLNGAVDKLVEEHGFTRPAAENLAKELAVRQSWVKTEQIIDDPGQKTQFDVMARNMFPFSRAVQATIRRWGTGLWQNPVAARKMMLTYEAAQHSGFIYTDQYGEPTFTYPGSGVMGMVMREVAQHVPGFENVAQFPIASDMTGSVLMAVPGADNPMRMSMGPMLSIPLREVYKHMLPQAWVPDAMKVDGFINGPIGVGETFSQLVPTAVRKFYDAFQADDRNSALAASTKDALANLAAAGLIPSELSSDTPSEMQKFINRVQDQVRSQLFLRAAFGLFAPAAPSSPTEGTSSSGADFAWQFSGIQQLSDEYKQILNETDGNVGEATAIFTALHPDEVVYKTHGGLSNPTRKLPASAFETGQTGTVDSGAYLPSTQSALKWMETNAKFIKNYGSVAAYFIPQGDTSEPFSYAAYQAQLEFGLRQKKTPSEFLNDVYLHHAEQFFYPAIDQFDAQINAADAAGNTQLKSQLEQQKSAWEAEYKVLNPLLGAKMDDYSSARLVANQQLNDLTTMVEHHNVPDGQEGLLGKLLITWSNYNAFTEAHQGSDSATVQARSNALAMLNQWAQENLTTGPTQSVWNSVLRVLNTNLVTLGTTD